MYHSIFIGGGAASFFAAIRLAELRPGLKIIIVEKGKEVLQKVRISGGGRCNVTNAISDPKELATYYPRGGKTLIGPFTKFNSLDTVAWFEERGVKIKKEADGRMFPVSNRSESILNCLISEAEKLNIEIRLHTNVLDIEALESGWKLRCADTELICNQLFIGAGSSSRIWGILKQFDIPVIDPVPSLFTFNIKDERLSDLPGIAITDAEIKIPGTKLSERGPVLITHWGLSGPGILRLSAWGAIELHERQYKFDIIINWLPKYSIDSIRKTIDSIRQTKGSTLPSGKSPFEEFPARFWKKIIAAAGIPEQAKWADLNKTQITSLLKEISESTFRVNGKSTFKEEFVTAGGVDLKAIDFKTFSVKTHPSLFMAGEILNIDGITGGFNFQAAWTGGWIAGTAMAERNYEL
jgi:predicted Rossmann fold flavoprotein